MSIYLEPAARIRARPVGDLTDMERSDIPQEVLHFIERRIDSVPHLEALLLLWEYPAHSWTEAEIAARVYVSRDHARDVLRGLARHGLISSAASPDEFVYNGRWDEDRLMAKVATAYGKHLVSLSSLIHSKTASEAVRQFARAFDFKNKE